MQSLTNAQARMLANRRKGPRRPKPRTQILRMQASMLAAAVDTAIPPHVRASCAKAWDVLQERLRIMDGKPLPGHLQPHLETKRKRAPKAMLAIAAADMPTQSQA